MRVLAQALRMLSLSFSGDYNVQALECVGVLLWLLRNPSLLYQKASGGPLIRIFIKPQEFDHMSAKAKVLKPGSSRNPKLSRD